MLKTDLLSLYPDEIGRVLAELGQPAYRARQVFAWLSRGVGFEGMTDLPQSLRERLAQRCDIARPDIARELCSRDGTRKLLLSFADGQTAECVIMRYHHGATLCISTQAGCRMGCAFCASTLAGLARDLTAGEMIAQVLAANRALSGDGARVGNVVLMGMGEPLDNYDNVCRFLRLMHDERGLNLSLRGVSLSTCGLVPQMRAFAREGLPVTLCVSLHAPDDETRAKLMPVARAYALTDLLDACRDYIRETGRRVIFEYALVEGVNCELSHARALASRLRGMQCHVNVIPLNGVPERGLRAPGETVVKGFLAELTRLHISATRRRTLGEDIQGACGQLRMRERS